jgi:hypothetical protein
MNEYYFSPSTNAFYPSLMFDDYNAAKTLPDDLNPVSNEVFIEFSGLPPEGKIRSPGSDGMPSWQDVPPPTHEEEVATAEQYRQQLLRQIDDVTADWRVELMLGDISDEDKANLTEWMAYKKEVKAVDTSTAPDVTWPEPPAE